MQIQPDIEQVGDEMEQPVVSADFVIDGEQDQEQTEVRVRAMLEELVLQHPEISFTITTRY